MTPSIIISVCGLIISLFALGVSFYGMNATRRHNRLSVTPHLSGNWNTLTDDSGLTLSYVVKSDGLGPARIKSFTFFQDGKPIPRDKGSYVANVIRERLEGKVKYHIKHNFEPGVKTYIRAGEACTIGEVFFPGAKPADGDRLKQLVEDLVLRIEYESFYDLPYVFDTRD